MPALPLPEGALGFDVNGPLSRDVAGTFLEAGYTFVCRYLPRLVQRENDLTAAELDALRSSGLWVIPVQHVESGKTITSPMELGALKAAGLDGAVGRNGWIASEAKGRLYGKTAARRCTELAIAPKTTVWLDLEGVATDVTADDIRAYCNAWYVEVQSAGFTPGIYVGWQCGLSPDQLYHNLAFSQYWAAYNLNLDQLPAKRGCMMLQRAARAEDVPAGLSLSIDIDLVTSDAFGDVPFADDLTGGAP